MGEAALVTADIESLCAPGGNPDHEMVAATSTHVGPKAVSGGMHVTFQASSLGAPMSRKCLLRLVN